MSSRPSSSFLLGLALVAAALPGSVSGQEAPPTDPQIAHIAVTANAIDAELGELAVSHASDPEVVAFARTMIRDHTSVNERAGALAARLHVVPAEHAVSAALLEGAAAARHGLESKHGAAFDRAYMEREVAYHQAVLDALDGLLIPHAGNGELRAFLEEVRPAIAAHLDHARSLAHRLTAGR